MRCFLPTLVLLFVVSSFSTLSASSLPSATNPESKENHSASQAQADSEGLDSIYIAKTMTQVTDSSFLTGKVTVDVELEIGKLELKDNMIEGRYKVTVDLSDVPAPFRLFAGSKNEEGTIKLPTNLSLKELLDNGGELKGKGFCERKGESREITCTIIPSNGLDETGPVKLVIDSGKRLMHFDSKYSVNKPADQSSEQLAQTSL